MDDNTKPLLEAHKQCDLFFKEVLSEAIDHQRVKISEEVAFYLLGILIGTLRYEEKDRKRHEDIMAKAYVRAVAGQCHDLFKVVGDSSLVIAGIWWQELARKFVDVDYYVNIGVSSYKKAGETGQRSLSDLFDELAGNFTGLVDILTEATACIYQSNLSNSDILRMYEVWLRTHNIFLAKKLKDLGVNVVPGTTTRQ